MSDATTEANKIPEDQAEQQPQKTDVGTSYAEMRQQHLIESEKRAESMIEESIASDERSDRQALIIAGSPDPATAHEQRTQEREMAEKLSDVTTRPMPTNMRLAVANEEDGYHYRWINDSPERLAYVEMLGYELAPKSSEQGQKSESGQDNAVRRGGLVLVRVKDEDFALRQQGLQRTTEAAMSAPRELFKTQAQNSGVETQDETRTSRSPLFGNR